ncbi:uncharacterized protein [Triticum aestivum]|uniref:uncharacterized protein n=1 Tax=Triticum aestivum TaxID=4565 RepID=UPI001D02343E|nr:uncharacterized protein LOC123084446 [Triticum aestivum]
MEVEGRSSSKMQVFRCFQMDRTVRRVREECPFRIALDALRVEDAHQCRKVSPAGRAVVAQTPSKNFMPNNLGERQQSRKVLHAFGSFPNNILRFQSTSNRTPNLFSLAFGMQLSMFVSLRVTPKSLDILSKGPPVCGDLAVSLSQAGPQFTQIIRCNYAIKALRFSAALLILKDEFLRSRDYSQCPPTYHLFQHFRELGYACINYGQFDSAKETFEAIVDHERMLDLFICHLNPSALRRLAQKLEESGTDPELRRYLERILRVRSTEWTQGVFANFAAEGMVPKGGNWEIKTPTSMNSIPQWELAGEVMPYMRTTDAAIPSSTMSTAPAPTMTPSSAPTLTTLSVPTLIAPIIDPPAASAPTPVLPPIAVSLAQQLHAMEGPCPSQLHRSSPPRLPRRLGQGAGADRDDRHRRGRTHRVQSSVQAVVDAGSEGSRASPRFDERGDLRTTHRLKDCGRRLDGRPHHVPRGAPAAEYYMMGLAHLEQNQLTDALNCLDEAFLALAKHQSREADIKAQATICAQYKIAVSLLQEIARLQRVQGAGTLSAKEDMGRLSRHLASLPIQAKHRINCIRTAIKRNMEVQNFAYAKQMLDLLYSKAPPTKQDELKSLIDMCVQRGLTNKSIDPFEDPSQFCAVTLSRLSTIGHDFCDLCGAKFSALSAPGCVICGMGSIKRSDALAGGGPVASPFA